VSEKRSQPLETARQSLRSWSPTAILTHNEQFSKIEKTRLKVSKVLLQRVTGFVTVRFPGNFAHTMCTGNKIQQ